MKRRLQMMGKIARVAALWGTAGQIGATLIAADAAAFV